MAQVVVVGAGAMGLAAAFQATRLGHDVTVIEAAPEPGGMAAHFDIAGLSIERFYHFICKSDQPTFELLDELGMGDRLRWRATSMGYYIGGRLHRWGDPIALLRFPGVSLVARLRYGLFAFVATRRERWESIERENARAWITRWCGRQAYDTLWKPLFDLKFYEYADNISAAWIWTRIKRVGRSRRSIFVEELGYLDGGSQTLIDGLCKAIEAGGGKLRLATPARRIVSDGKHVTGVETPIMTIPAEHVICTVPTPYVADLVPDLPESWRRRYNAIQNIGVCCLVFRLRKQVSPHFWININDRDCPVPGIIEFSNLRAVGDSIVYVPYYMPVSNPKFGWPDAQLLGEAFSVLRRLNPALSSDDIVASHVARLRHAQPVCEPGFSDKIPPIQTPIAGLQIADTCFYYPEDRGIAESVRLGRDMARRII